MKMTRALLIVTVLGMSAAVTHADRSAAQGPTGWEFERKGRFAEAALYYDRAIRGFEEVWIRFWYADDAAKAHPQIRELLASYRTHLADCLKKGKVDAAQRERMERLTDFWMEEFVVHELGGYKLSFAWRAEEAEKHGDFLFAAELRAAAADYVKRVAASYHKRCASKLEKAGKTGEAALHRKAAADCDVQAAAHEALARGDRVLARIAGLQGPASKPQMQDHYFNSYRLYHQRVLNVDGKQWLTGRTEAQVSAILKEKGLTHRDADARRAAETVLANLGEGNAPAPNAAGRQGLLRANPDGSTAVDLTVDLGTWWQSGGRSIHGRPNPLTQFGYPAKFTWRGYLVVADAGEYRFFVRNRGGKRQTFGQQEGLYFAPPSATLTVDGVQVVPNPSHVIEDAKMHVRIDGSDAIVLKPGLHEISLQLDVTGAGTLSWEAPAVRLYWQSDRFLRQVVPAEHLVLDRKAPARP